MSLTSLNAITPIDGRYISKTSSLQEYFSESALIKFRVQVEIEYFIALCNSSILQLNHFPTDKFPGLRSLYSNFSEQDAQRIKDIESITNHDVKAVEYFIKEKMDLDGIGEAKDVMTRTTNPKTKAIIAKMHKLVRDKLKLKSVERIDPVTSDDYNGIAFVFGDKSEGNKFAKYLKSQRALGKIRNLTGNRIMVSLHY